MRWCLLSKKRGYIPKKKARPTDVVEWAIKRNSEKGSEGRCPIGFPEKMPDRVPRKETEKQMLENRFIKFHRPFRQAPLVKEALSNCGTSTECVHLRNMQCVT